MSFRSVLSRFVLSAARCLLQASFEQVSKMSGRVDKSENFVAGSQVQIHISQHGFKVSKVLGESRMVELCAAITPGNVHRQTEWGTPQGGEIW